MNNFSTFKAPIKGKNTLPDRSTTLSDLHKVILSDKHKRITAKLRSLTSKAEVTMCKEMELDFITPSGTFVKRADKSLLQHSNLFCIDCDHVGTGEALTDLQQQIRSIFEPALMFVSPSGDGLKIIFQIDINQAEHIKYYFAFERCFMEEFKVPIDDKCKNVSRATFLCYDPECFYTETPTVLGLDFINKYSTVDPPKVETKTAVVPQQPAADSNRITDPVEIIKRLKIWAERNYPFAEGRRNEHTSQLCGAFNRYGINEGTALDTLLQYAETGFPEDGIRATVRSIYADSSYHNTEHFEAVTGADITPLMPIDGFPVEVQNVINECSEIYGTHRDLWAAAIMAAAASAIGQSTIVKTKYENPPLFWFAIVGPSGVGKSEPIDVAFKQIQDVDLAAYKIWQIECADYIARQNEGGSKAKNNPKPIKPKPCSQHIVSDITPEKMAEAMTARPKGITIIRDELMGWIADFGRYGNSGVEQSMLSTWSQQTYKRSRKSGDDDFIVKPFSAVLGGIQPGLLKDLAKDNRAISGFLPRFCIVWPDKIEAAGHNPNELTYEIKKQYRDFIIKLMNLPGFRTETRLSDEAMKLYGDFVNHNAALNNSGKQPDYLNEVNAKLNIIALRFAILFHCSRQVYTDSGYPYINAPVMQSAIDLTEYFRITARKVYNVISDKGSNRVDVVKYLQSLGNSQREIANIMKLTQPRINQLLKTG